MSDYANVRAPVTACDCAAACGIIKKDNAYLCWPEIPFFMNPNAIVISISNALFV